MESFHLLVFGADEEWHWNWEQHHRNPKWRTSKRHLQRQFQRLTSDNEIFKTPSERKQRYNEKVDNFYLDMMRHKSWTLLRTT